VKHVAMIVFWVAVTLCGLALAWAFRSAAILMLLSMAVSAALRPMVDRLMARGLSASAAIAATYLLSLGVVGVLAYVLTSRLLVEVPTAIDGLVEGYRNAAATWPRAGGYREFLSGVMPPPSDFQQAVGDVEASSVAGQALGTTLGLLDVVGQTLLVMVLSIYWTSGRDAFERLWLSFLPGRRRHVAQSIWIAIRRNVGSHLRRELVLSVLVGIILTIGLRLVGCELWALATVSVLVLRLIPLLGGPAAVLAVLVISATSGVVPAILSTALGLALLIVLRLVVAPRTLHVERQLDPILAVVVILALAAHFGLVGLVAATLVAVAVQTLFAEVIALRASEADLPTVGELTARAARLERRFRWTPPSPPIASLLSRLQYLIERAASR